MAADAKDIYVGSLHSTHAVEAQGLTQMENQVNTLDAYPQYQALLQRHIETTRAQIARIETALEELGSGSSAIRDAATSAAGAVGAVGTVFHRLQQDATLKNLYAGYAYQHEQIAAYRSLAVIARAAGFGGHASWIGQSEDEERQDAEEVEAIIEPATEQCLQLSLEPA